MLFMSLRTDTNSKNAPLFCYINPILSSFNKDYTQKNGTTSYHINSKFNLSTGEKSSEIYELQKNTKISIY